MKNNRITKRVYEGKCRGKDLISRPWKRWIDSANDFLKKKNKKRDLDFGQARRIHMVGG